MPHYRRVGEVPRKRHSYVQAEGGYLFEELMGHEGFAQESVTALSPALAERDRRGGSRRTHTGGRDPRLAAGPASLADRRRVRRVPMPCSAARRCFENDDVRIAWFAATVDSDLFRDAIGDQLVYVQSGRGVLESSFGALAVGPGDYVSIPAAMTHRWCVEDGAAHSTRARVARPHQDPGEVLERTRSAPRRRTVLGARPPRPRRTTRA